MQHDIDIPIMLSVEQSVYAKEVTTNSFGHWNDLRDLLREVHAVTLKDKGENMLMSGSVFHADADSETTKSLDDLVYSHMLQLDFDDSQLDPRILSRLLGDIKHLAYNSFNNGREDLFRYRVVIPLSVPVTKEVYEGLWDIIAHRVLDAGYSVGKQRGRNGFNSGLDVGKRTPASFMYLPSQAATKSSTFWIENWNEPVLNVMEWAERIPADAPEYVETEAVSNQSKKVKDLMLAIRRGDIKRVEQDDRLAADRRKQQALERALEDWTSTPSGEGNAGFFRFGARLARAGYDLTEVQQFLHQHHADSASDSGDRKSQIPSIMASLKRNPTGASKTF